MKNKQNVRATTTHGSKTEGAFFSKMRKVLGNQKVFNDNNKKPFGRVQPNDNQMHKKAQIAGRKEKKKVAEQTSIGIKIKQRDQTIC